MTTRFPTTREHSTPPLREPNPPKPPNIHGGCWADEWRTAGFNVRTPPVIFPKPAQAPPPLVHQKLFRAKRMTIGAPEGEKNDAVGSFKEFLTANIGEKKSVPLDNLWMITANSEDPRWEANAALDRAVDATVADEPKTALAELQVARKAMPNAIAVFQRKLRSARAKHAAATLDPFEVCLGSMFVELPIGALDDTLAKNAAKTKDWKRVTTEYNVTMIGVVEEP